MTGNQGSPVTRLRHLDRVAPQQKRQEYFFHKSALLFREKCFYFLEKSVFFNFLEKSEALFSKKLKTWFLISEYLVISLSLYTNLYI